VSSSRVEGSAAARVASECPVGVASSAMGITVYGSDGAGIRDLTIEENFIHDCRPAPSEALVVNGNVQR
jgi:hypothetical protein